MTSKLPDVVRVRPTLSTTLFKTNQVYDFVRHDEDFTPLLAYLYVYDSPSGRLVVQTYPQLCNVYEPASGVGMWCLVDE